MNTGNVNSKTYGVENRLHVFELRVGTPKRMNMVHITWIARLQIDMISGALFFLHVRKVSTWKIMWQRAFLKIWTYGVIVNLYVSSFNANHRLLQMDLRLIVRTFIAIALQLQSNVMRDLRSKNGSYTRTCNERGTWVPPTTQCERTRCNNFVDVGHEAVIAFPQLLFGDNGSVTYNADFFYLTRGSTEVTCSSEKRSYGKVHQLSVWSTKFNTVNSVNSYHKLVFYILVKK